MEVVEQIYKLRQNFILIGLTGRTGSGCSTVAEMLKNEDVSNLKGEHQDFRGGKIDNDVRKNRIVRNFISENWYPFTVISASDVIFYYALQLSFEGFVRAIVNPVNSWRKSKIGGDESILEEQINSKLEDLRSEYETLHTAVCNCEDFFNQNQGEHSNLLEYKKLLVNGIRKFRSNLMNCLQGTQKEMLTDVLQTWGE